MIILGSTGTIGVRALEIACKFGKRIEAIAAGRNISLLNSQIARYKPKKVAIAFKEDLDKLEPQGAQVFVGQSGMCEMIEGCESGFVLNGIVGFAGLLPSLHAQKCGKKLALANKESLVAGGWLLDRSAITPIDSEHFGLWYLLNNPHSASQSSQSLSNQGIENQSEGNQSADNQPQHIKRLIITASGGAFRDMELESIPCATKAQALKHPNWQMGQKITIDSASMANKLFEVLEAYWLFGCKEVNAVIERSSSIHALVEFIDGSTTAHFALPDMSLPIAYALDSSKARSNKILDSLDLSALGALCFENIECVRYPLWELKDTLLENPKLGVVVNAANEVAISKFLRDEIAFGEIARIVFGALERFESESKDLSEYESIAMLDAEVRETMQ
ncbi:1-deoxy-D-xylulose-5-phosphate reductoisomerase [Helicobacter macacae]|uniref:1-deoxy-D-xylulose 5-phosphate reductoisomerase n=1 Tax=Helicobacter macacae MIT 99-5501 TaxID=1357400 RepID=V8CB30_9HELI|nr:1-deoxy-D-xylulose-5-phosphate reductoisomerase [Helicobacter macacae]ETD23931.1 1-deoxy-D-xylulose 5-phosphate reductoisomerase [Helicobacter macacae MIT 99-5501]